MNHSGQQRQETLHHNPWKEQKLERQVRMPLPCCVIWGKPHNLSGSACQRGRLVLASCACPVGLCNPPSEAPPPWSRQAFLFTRGPSRGWEATALASSAPRFLPLPLQCLRPGPQGPRGQDLGAKSTGAGASEDTSLPERASSLRP